MKHKLCIPRLDTYINHIFFIILNLAYRDRSSNIEEEAEGVFREQFQFPHETYVSLQKIVSVFRIYLYGNDLKSRAFAKMSTFQSLVDLPYSCCRWHIYSCSLRHMASPSSVQHCVRQTHYPAEWHSTQVQG